MARVWLLLVLACACATEGVRWSREVNSYVEDTSDWVPCTTCTEENKIVKEAQSRSLDVLEPGPFKRQVQGPQSRALSDYNRPLYLQHQPNYLALGSSNVESAAPLAPNFGQVVPKAHGFGNFPNFGPFGFPQQNFAPPQNFRSNGPPKQFAFESPNLPNYNQFYQFPNRFIDGYRAENQTVQNQNRPAQNQNREEVQLLYVPLDTLNKNPNRFKSANVFRGNLPNAEHINNQLREPEYNFISSTLAPDFFSTLAPKPKLKAHQPPLAMFAATNELLEREGLQGALKKLKRSQQISVLDNFDSVGVKPDIFVGPNNMKTPLNYLKYELPYLSGGQTSGRNMFVAPLSYKTPNGFVKIPLPQPHVGSLVFNLIDDDKISTVSYFTTEPNSQGIEDNSEVSIEPQAVMPLRRPTQRPQMPFESIHIGSKPTKIPVMGMPLMYTTRIAQNSTPKQSSSNPFAYTTSRATPKPIASYFSTTLLGPQSYYPLPETTLYRDKGHYITKFSSTTPNSPVEPITWRLQQPVPVPVENTNAQKIATETETEDQKSYYVPDFVLPNKINDLGLGAEVSSTTEIPSYTSFKQPEMYSQFAPSVSPFDHYEQTIQTIKPEVEEIEVKPSTPSYNSNSIAPRGQSKIREETYPSSTTTTTTTRRTPTRSRTRVSSRTTTQTPDDAVSSTTKRSYRERRPSPSPTRRAPTKPTEVTKSSRNSTTPSASTRNRGRLQYKPESNDEDEPKFVAKRKKTKPESSEELAYQRDVLNQNYPVTLSERMSTSGLFETVTEKIRQPTKSVTIDDDSKPSSSSTGAFSRISSKYVDYSQASATPTESYKLVSIGFSSPSPTTETTPKKYASIERQPSTIPYFTRQAIFESSTKEEDDKASEGILKTDQNVEIPKTRYDTIRPVESTEIPVEPSNEDAPKDEFKQLIRTRSKFRPSTRTKIEDTFTERTILENQDVSTKPIANVRPVTYRPAFKRDRTTMKIEDIQKDFKTKMLAATHKFNYPVYSPNKDKKIEKSEEEKEESTTVSTSSQYVVKPFRSYKRRGSTTTAASEPEEEEATTSTPKIATRGKYRARIRSKPTVTETTPAPDSQEATQRYTFRGRSTQSYKMLKSEGSQDVDAGQSVIVQQFIPFNNDVSEIWSTKVSDNSFKPSQYSDSEFESENVGDYSSSGNDDLNKPITGEANDDATAFDYTESETESTPAQDDYTETPADFDRTEQLDIVTAGPQVDDVLVEVTPATNIKITNSDADTTEQLTGRKQSTNGFYIPPTLEALDMTVNNRNDKKIDVKGISHDTLDVERVLDEAMKFLEKQDEKEYYKDSVMPLENAKFDKISSDDTEVIVVAKKPKRRGYWKVNKKPIRIRQKEHLELSESQYYSNTFNDLTRNEDKESGDFGMKISSNQEEKVKTITEAAPTTVMTEMTTVPVPEVTTVDSADDDVSNSKSVVPLGELIDDSANTERVNVEKINAALEMENTERYTDATEYEETATAATVQDSTTPSYESLYDMITEGVSELFKLETETPKSVEPATEESVDNESTDPTVPPYNVDDEINEDENEEVDADEYTTANEALETDPVADTTTSAPQATEAVTTSLEPEISSEASQIQEVTAPLNDTKITENDKMLEKITNLLKTPENNDVQPSEEKPVTQRTDTTWQAEFFSTRKSTEVSHEAEICFRGKCIKTTEKDYMFRR